MRTGLLWCTQSRTQQCDTRGYAQLEEVHDTYQRMVGRPLGVPQFLGIGILYILVVLLVTTWFPMYISLLLCDGVQPFRGRTMWYPIHQIYVCMHSSSTQDGTKGEKRQAEGHTCTRKTHIPLSIKVREKDTQSTHERTDKWVSSQIGVHAQPVRDTFIRTWK